MEKADIGIIGLAVMGENLALNFESKNFNVSVYNRPENTPKSIVELFLENRGKDKNFFGAKTIKELVNSLKSPRVIMLMIRAGSPVDEVIDQLTPLLDKGDIIIDGGNSNFHDTTRRVDDLYKNGIYFVGSGVSGGEEGALHGPSIMPGGAPEAWKTIKPILQAISAKLPDGSPCCQWIGSHGAGHFVKMVHNGIEYADMQLISEAYQLMKVHGKINNDEMYSIFKEWNTGELNSYLVEITSDIFKHKDKKGNYLVDQILDVAGQKGTGKWTTTTALELNDPLTIITEAVFGRFLSGMKDERVKINSIYPSHHVSPVKNQIGFIEEVKNALFASKIISYTQGFELMNRASQTYGWNLNLSEIATIWRNGCIIRSSLLERISSSYKNDKNLSSLLMSEYFIGKIHEALPAWRRIVSVGALSGIAIPCISSGLSYLDALCTINSGANLIQAQRDYFGAHTYERVDEPRGVFFHTNWTGEGGATKSGSYTV